MKKFRVCVARTVSPCAVFEVEACDEEEAKHRALQEAHDFDFSDCDQGNPDYEVLDSRELIREMEEE